MLRGLFCAHTAGSTSAVSRITTMVVPTKKTSLVTRYSSLVTCYSSKKRQWSSARAQRNVYGVLLQLRETSMEITGHRGRTAHPCPTQVALCQSSSSSECCTAVPQPVVSERSSKHHQRAGLSQLHTAWCRKMPMNISWNATCSVTFT